MNARGMGAFGANRLARGHSGRLSAQLDLDVGGVVRRGKGARRARILHQADDPLRRELWLDREQRANRDIGDRPRPLMTGDRYTVDGGDVDRIRRGEGGYEALRGVGGVPTT